MHLEILVEEPSAEAALVYLVPKILGSEVSFAIHAYQGKLDLLSKMPNRLRGYRRWLPDDGHIVVLIDSDGKDCRQEKLLLEQRLPQPVSSPARRRGQDRGFRC